MASEPGICSDYAARSGRQVRDVGVDDLWHLLVLTPPAALIEAWWVRLITGGYAQMLHLPPPTSVTAGRINPFSKKAWCARTWIKSTDIPYLTVLLICLRYNPVPGNPFLKYFGRLKFTLTSQILCMNDGKGIIL